MSKKKPSNFTDRTGEHYKIINIKEKLKPYNGWKFIEIIK